MSTATNILNWIINNYQVVITAIVGLMTSIIAISLLIPGDQPEKALQSVVDFLTKFSKK